MKRYMLIITAILLLISLNSCSAVEPAADIVATTLPVYEFTAAVCAGSGLRIGRLVTENVSCLHDYTLQTSQMRMMEASDVLIISGAGLDDFACDMWDPGKPVIDASVGAHLHETESAHSHAHTHEQDPHIWLSPANAKLMAEAICQSLNLLYPEYADLFSRNLINLQSNLDTLQVYGENSLRDLSCRDLITFHDGFAYFAESFDLTILHSVEEESGSEASASELIELIDIVQTHNLPAIFIEENASVSAASIISEETDTAIYALNMAMSGESYFDAMYQNIDTVKEALG